MASEQIALAQALDALNAFGFMEAFQKRPLCFGPQDVLGDGWIGVVVWCRQSGYYSYKAIDLTGIWAVATDGEPLIILGRRTLQYTAGYYNPESYFHHLRKSFETYYGKDASPPDNPIFQTLYDPSHRLELRHTLQSHLETWTDEGEK